MKESRIGGEEFNCIGSLPKCQWKPSGEVGLPTPLEYNNRKKTKLSNLRKEKRVLTGESADTKKNNKEIL